MAKRLGVKKVRVHCFMDGRDVPPCSGSGYIEELEEKIAAIFNDVPEADVRIGVISVAIMRWIAIIVGIVLSKLGVQFGWVRTRLERSAQEVMEDSYAADVTDEFVVPVSLTGEAASAQDAFIFFNFRPDRAREISRALCDPAFDAFARPGWEKPEFVCLTEYDPIIPAPTAFPKVIVPITCLPMCLLKKGFVNTTSQKRRSMRM